MTLSRVTWDMSHIPIMLTACEWLIVCIPSRESLTMSRSVCILSHIPIMHHILVYETCPIMLTACEWLIVCIPFRESYQSCHTWDWYMRHVSFTRDMTQSQTTTHLCKTWCIRMEQVRTSSAMTHSHVTRLMHMWQVSFTHDANPSYVTCLSHSYMTLHPYLFICDMPHSFICDMPHLFISDTSHPIWHDSHASSHMTWLTCLIPYDLTDIPPSPVTRIIIWGCYD